MSKKETAAQIHKRVTGRALTGDLAADESVFYHALRGQIDTAITQCKVLCSEAYKAGDQKGVWEMGARIKEWERQKASMREPVKPAAATK